MSRSYLRSARYRVSLAVLGACLVVRTAAAAPDKPQAPPDRVLASQQQHARWIAAFNGWRGAESSWSGESPTEVKMRRETRLTIIPTFTPMLSGQRRLDGRSVIISSGLVALLEELLLAEAVSEMQDRAGRLPNEGCFEAYSALVGQVIEQNQKMRDRTPPTPPDAWPRLTEAVAASRVDQIGQTYDPRMNRYQAGKCQSVTSAQLKSRHSRQWVSDGVDTLAFWIFTRKNMQLAQLPTWDQSKKDTTAPACALASAKESAAPKHQLAVTQLQVQVQVEIRVCAPQPEAAIEPTLSQFGARARQAILSTGRPELKTARWLLTTRDLIDAGTSTGAKRDADKMTLTAGSTVNMSATKASSDASQSR